MYQQNYTYQPQQYGRFSPSSGLKGRPVSSIEEARAISIDFDGSVFYFPDVANKRIYSKQINMDGTSTLLMYELKPVPVAENIDQNNYVTRQEFEATMEQIKSLLTPNIVQVQETQPKPEFNF